MTNKRKLLRLAMTIHLDSQADLEDAITALVKLDPRLKPVLDHFLQLGDGEQSRGGALLKGNRGGEHGRAPP